MADTNTLNKRHVDIYTDGACSGNPGPGGWAAILMYGAAKKEISGYEPDTTNNQMELLAAIRALDCLKEPCDVSLYSDSAYLVDCFRQGWIYGWMKNNWVTSKKDPVKNIPLWQALYAHTKTHRLEFIKVKGHSDNKYNNRCDEMATGQIAEHAAKSECSNENITQI